VSRPWTTAHTRTLRQLAARDLTLREISERMGRCSRHVNQRAERHGIDVRRVCIKQPWTAEQDRILRDRYATDSAKEIAALVGHSVSATENRAHGFGLHKSREWQAARARQRWREGRHENSRASQFRKGDAPVNKGRPMAEWMPPESMARSAKTRFKKGCRLGAANKNHVPVGTLRISKDGYLERKMHDGGETNAERQRRWVGVHRLVWESANGPIPRGHVVVFRSGARTNVEAEITLDKLELVTRRQLLDRNTVQRFPEPLRRAIQLRGALNRKINHVTKKEPTP